MEHPPEHFHEQLAAAVRRIRLESRRWLTIAEAITDEHRQAAGLPPRGEQPPDRD